MTELCVTQKRMRGYPIRPASRFPGMRGAMGFHVATEIDENDELFIGYGTLPNPLPYTMQDCYGGELETLVFDSVILENEHLRAEFLPGVGGRLWSLYDKKARRDLLLNNAMFIPGNFAVRNAWVAGGVEWNIGRRGHDARTCSALFAATTQDDDGTPVLRMYEFNRDRAVTYQMDFYLPPASRYLMARMRIVNPHAYVVPMYWWSNTAVEERDGQRIVTPAYTSFANAYVSDTEHRLTKVPMPCNEGIDCTFPANHWNAKDHFFNIAEPERKFIAAVEADGYGVVQCSTPRLKGRKLFVWGQSPGGQHWQRKLAAPGGPNYLEIQAGLCQTQMECLPMPPKAAWEWLECYGPIEVPPNSVTGGWDEAINAVAKELEARLPRETVDDELTRTRQAFALKPAQMILQGSGWGALENRRRKCDDEPELSPYLDFGDVGHEQQEWLYLLEHGRMPAKDPNACPASYMVQDEWFARLQASPRDDWYTQYHLALNLYQRQDYERAETLIAQSLTQQRTLWGLHALANIYRATGCIAQSVDVWCEALAMAPDDESLAKEALKTCNEAGDYQALHAFCGLLADQLRHIPMVRFFHAAVSARQGDLDGAERILMTLEIPDIREGENSLSELYAYIQRAKEPHGLQEIEIPFQMDLRMNQPRKVVGGGTAEHMPTRVPQEGSPVPA